VVKRSDFSQGRVKNGIKKRSVLMSMSIFNPIFHARLAKYECLHQVLNSYVNYSSVERSCSIDTPSRFL